MNPANGGAPICSCEEIKKIVTKCMLLHVAYVFVYHHLIII